MSQSRLPLMKVHAALAGFFLPVAFMFFITGALYTWGIKGKYGSTDEVISLASPLAKDNKAGMQELVVKLLDERSLSHPTGGSNIKSGGTSFYFEWTGSNRDITLQPTSNPLEAKLQIKNTTLHRRFVQLHKAKGGVVFKVFAASLAVGLLVLFLTGFRLALGMPQVKKVALTGAGAGIVAFLAIVLLS